MNEAKDSETVAGLSVIIAGGRDYELTPRSLATVSKLLSQQAVREFTRFGIVAGAGIS